MALINCPECKKEISDTAKSCPQCGHPLEDNKSKEKKNATQKDMGIMTKFFIVLIGAWLLFTFIKSDDEPNSNKSKLSSMMQDKKEKISKEQTLTIMSPSSIFNEFKNNEVAAEEKYKNKLVALQGKISSIESSIMGYPEIVFNISYNIETVKCTFPKEDREFISKLKKGQTVTLIGEVTSFTLGTLLSLEDCYFATPEKK